MGNEMRGYQLVKDNKDFMIRATHQERPVHVLQELEMTQLEGVGPCGGIGAAELVPCPSGSHNHPYCICDEGTKVMGFGYTFLRLSVFFFFSCLFLLFCFVFVFCLFLFFHKRNNTHTHSSG